MKKRTLLIRITVLIAIALLLSACVTATTTTMEATNTKVAKHTQTNSTTQTDRGGPGGMQGGPGSDRHEPDRRQRNDSTTHPGTRINHQEHNAGTGQPNGPAGSDPDVKNAEPDNWLERKGQ